MSRPASIKGKENKEKAKDLTFSPSFLKEKGGREADILMRFSHHIFSHISHHGKGKEEGRIAILGVLIKGKEFFANRMQREKMSLAEHHRHVEKKKALRGKGTRIILGRTFLPQEGGKPQRPFFVLREVSLLWEEKVVPVHRCVGRNCNTGLKLTRIGLVKTRGVYRVSGGGLVERMWPVVIGKKRKRKKSADPREHAREEQPLR